MTSLFSSSTVKKAYAVCNGKIFAQEVNGKINIVLSPTQQPIGIFAPVKYYVYKGLTKDSVVDADGVHIAGSAKSDLTRIINETQNLRNAALGRLTGQTITTRAGLNSVGLDLTAAAPSPKQLLDTALLHDVFLRVDEDEFPSVDGGHVIGQFDQTDFGFEIVLDGLGEGPTLQSLRNAQTIITANPSPNGDVNKFREEDKREQILNYMDPCAFYASFFFDGIRVKLDSSDAKFVARNKAPLYDEVLVKFLTSDIVYLDLRNEHNHGFNYYRNYNIPANDYAQFHIKYDGVTTTTTLKDYQSFSWPIFRVQTSVFTNPDAKKPSTIVLNLPQGDNTSPGVYRNQGYFFAGFKRMSQPPDVTEILRMNLAIEADNFTIPIAFSIPKLPNNTTLPSYINIRYLKRIGAPPPTNPPAGNLTLKAEHFLDNLFELTHLVSSNGLKIPLNTDAITQWHVTGSTAVVDSSSGYGRDYVAKIGVAGDQNNVYFFACRDAARMVSGATTKTSFLPVLLEAHKANIEFGFRSFQDLEGVSQPILMHDGLPDGLIDISPGPFTSDVDEKSIVILALDKDQLPLIQDAANSLEPAFDKRLALRNKQDYVDNNRSVTAAVYDLFVIGYEFDSGVSILSVNTNIRIRNGRFTPRLFSSKDAALNFEGLRGVSQNRKHFAKSKMLLDVDWGIRNIYQTDESAAATSNGTQWEFCILGKKSVFDSTEDQFFDWYFVELQQDIPSDSPYPSMAMVPKGSRRWIRAHRERFYPVASFEKFVTDLIMLNDSIDQKQSQMAAPLDTLSERITRFRQMTKELTESGGVISISKLFDELIGSSATSPPGVKRLNEIGYILFGPQEELVDDFNVTLTIDTEIQLFRDYMGVELGGVVVDLHHLFIGLDVLFHADADKSINPFVMIESGLDPGLRNLPQFYPLGSNVDKTTWAGDIGAAPADFVSLADADFRGALDPKLTESQLETRLLEHFYKTRAPDHDLYPDVYAHLLHKQLLRHLQREPGFRNLPAALYHFNLQLISEGDRDTFREFCAYLNFNLDQPLITQADRVSEVLKGILEFADLWWIRNNPGTATAAYLANIPLVVLANHQRMQQIALLYALYFLRWLEVHK